MKTRIVIVGGGAGGLELACKLGRELGAEQVTLVDRQLFHIWKPSLHEVAAGTLDIHQEGLSYEMLAHDNRFTFCLGAMTALDVPARRLSVAPVLDEQGDELVPARELPFDRLVIAVGSTANHFNVPGAAEFTLSLNRPADAERFRLRMLKLLTAADLRKSAGAEGQVRIVIIGGGATGVELAAELREASVVHSRYGFRRLDPHRDVQITLLEGADRILSPLPEKVSEAATALLKERNVAVETACKVARITARQVEDASGRVFASDLVVWAAGIKAPGWQVGRAPVDAIELATAFDVFVSAVRLDAQHARIYSEVKFFGLWCDCILCFADFNLELFADSNQAGVPGHHVARVECGGSFAHSVRAARELLST